MIIIGVTLCHLLDSFRLNRRQAESNIKLAWILPRRGGGRRKPTYNLTSKITPKSDKLIYRTHYYTKKEKIFAFVLTILIFYLYLCPPNCRLTSPATVANLWVCTSIKAITISMTSWLTSMLTSHHWYHSSMQCSTLRTDYLMFMCRQTDNLWCKLPLWR